VENDLAVIRPANQTYEDGLAFAKYVDMASEGGLRKALGYRYEDIMANAFIEPNHDLSYTYTFFAEFEGAIVGMVSGYPAKTQRVSSHFALKRAAGSRFRRMLGIVLLGFVSGVHGGLDKDAYYLQFLGVDKSARGKGIGTKLLIYMENRALADKCVHFSIDVSAKNPGAQRLYERCGMIITSEWPKPRFFPSVVYRMNKDI
jgi:ribosomal protein S18 acetylase RimI-like enzyme